MHGALETTGYTTTIDEEIVSRHQGFGKCTAISRQRWFAWLVTNGPCTCREREGETLIERERDRQREREKQRPKEIEAFRVVWGDLL